MYLCTYLLHIPMQISILTSKNVCPYPRPFSEMQIGKYMRIFLLSFYYQSIHSLKSMVSFIIENTQSGKLSGKKCTNILSGEKLVMIFQEEFLFSLHSISHCISITYNSTSLQRVIAEQKIFYYFCMAHRLKQNSHLFSIISRQNDHLVHFQFSLHV